MGNFCINCGAKLRKEDNYCTNCGTKIIKEDNICTNCGAKLRKNDNFCTNCGTKVDNPDSSKSASDLIEKRKAKKELKRVVGGSILYNTTFGNELQKNGLDVYIEGKAIRQQVEKEIDSGQIKSGEVESRVNQLIQEYKIKKIEEEKKKLKTINKIFESEEIQSEIIKNKIDQKHVVSIKNSLENKLITKREIMSEEEIKNFIKTELKKAKKEQETARISEEIKMRSKKINETGMNNGGYCSLNCAHCYEEFLDNGGGIVGDFDSEGCVDYYCRLGHSISFGCFCDDYR